MASVFRGQIRHPATGPTPPLTVFRDLSEHLLGSDPFSKENGSDPRIISISDKCVDQGRHLPTAVGICQRRGGVGVRGVSGRGMPRAGCRTPNPGLAVRAGLRARASGCQAYRDVLAAPRTPTPAHQSTECPLLLLLLLLLLQVQGCKPCQQNPLARGSLRVACSGTLTDDGPGPRRPSPSAAGPAC